MIMAGGGRYYPADPRPEDVNIADIAHALANLCRWGGHCPHFYSVAEHSVLVSYQVPREHALTALMHDATEAYLGDVPRPIKVCLPEYKRMEALNWLAIAERFRLPNEMPQCVHYADNAVLLAEANEFFAERLEHLCIIDMPGHVKSADVPLRCWSPESARRAFTLRFHELIADRIEEIAS
jgi:hypothetical protein